MVVPTQAVQTGQKGSFVFVVKAESIAEVRSVVAGPAYEAITVIDSGLDAGEQVVIDGQMRVVPGSKVEIKAANKEALDGKDKPTEAATPGVGSSR